MRKKPKKKVPAANVVVAAAVVACLALAVILGVRGILTSGETGPDASEAARKKAHEEAMTKGNLSLYEARYWRLWETAASAETGGRE